MELHIEHNILLGLKKDIVVLGRECEQMLQEDIMEDLLEGRRMLVSGVMEFEAKSVTTAQPSLMTTGAH